MMMMMSGGRHLQVGYVTQLMMRTRDSDGDSVWTVATEPLNQPSQSAVSGWATP